MNESLIPLSEEIAAHYFGGYLKVDGESNLVAAQSCTEVHTRLTAVLQEHLMMLDEDETAPPSIMLIWENTASGIRTTLNVLQTTHKPGIGTVLNTHDAGILTQILGNIERMRND